MVTLAYPVNRLDWALFSAVILFHHWFSLSLLEKVENWTFILPCNFPVVLIIFAGPSGAGNQLPSSPKCGAGRPSLHFSHVCSIFNMPAGGPRPALPSTPHRPAAGARPQGDHDEEDDDDDDDRDDVGDDDGAMMVTKMKMLVTKMMLHIPPPCSRSLSSNNN